MQSKNLLIHMYRQNSLIQEWSLCDYSLEIALVEKHKSFHMLCLQRAVANAAKYCRQLKFCYLLAHVLAIAKPVSVCNSSKFYSCITCYTPLSFNSSPSVQITQVWMHASSVHLAPGNCLQQSFFSLCFFSRDSYVRNMWQGRKRYHKPMLLSSLLLHQAVTFFFSSSLWVDEEVFLDFHMQFRYP